MMRARFRANISHPILVGAVIVLALASTLFVHLALLALPDDTTTPLMIVDRLFDLGYAGVLSIGSIGIGRWLLRKLGYSAKNVLSQCILAWAAGAGALSHGLLLLGMAHLLSRFSVLLVLVLVVGLTAKEWIAMARELFDNWQAHTPLDRFERIIIGVIVLLALPVLLGAMTPPTEGDALSYQLAAPARFLEQGAVVPILQNTGANYPLGASMLFTFGLAVGSPIAAQLTHFLFGLALMGAVYAFASENFGRTVGLIASAIYWTSPVIGLEANAPLVDLGWVFYEFLAIWMFWQWHQTRDRRPLILMAAFLGLAVSSKYLGFVGWVVLGILVLIDAFWTYRHWRPVVQCALLVGIVALIVASPWYLKNWFMLGNPVYPFFLGTFGLDGQIHKPTGALAGLGDWVGAGMGTDWQALLSFPLNVYVHWQRFDPVKNRGGPSLFFWFLPLYLIVPKRALINLLLLIVAIRFGVWWNLTQFVRYGLILFPLLSLVCGYIVWDVINRIKGRWGRPLLQIALALFFVVGIGLQWGFLFLLHEGSVPFLLGLQSQATYLDTNLHDARAIRFMNTTLPADAKVFALGDTRVFYLQRDVIGDVSHTNWAELTSLGQTVNGVRAQLRRMNVTHVWLSRDEITYARNFWNLPEPWQDPRVSFDELRNCCLEQLYEDDRGHSIYALRDKIGP